MEKILKCKYDSRNSFYNKAKTRRNGELEILTSYNTDVAIYNHKLNNIQVLGWFSQTTARHINEFLQIMGFDKLTKQEMEKKPFIQGN